jgi:hypothetical protein
VTEQSITSLYRSKLRTFFENWKFINPLVYQTVRFGADQERSLWESEIW